jgi:hypothetical protein
MNESIQDNRNSQAVFNNINVQTVFNNIKIFLNEHFAKLTFF